jgi:hypothetical protein
LIDGALFDQQLLERLLLIERPSVQRRDELVAVDEIHLQRQDSGQQIAIGGGTGHDGRSDSR